MKWYLKVLKNYANFRDRASRSEFWYFALLNWLFCVAAVILDNILGSNIDFGHNLHYGYIYIFYVLDTFIPGLAVTVRRLHDVGKTGWFYFIILIPLIGAI
jgi:uncharacterized membrane protein YhaH (DUF805 family)